MSKTVFVLGAGASAHCGTPLMGNFLEVAEDLWRSGEVEEVAEHFESVFDAIGNLQGIHSKAKLDTYNIETIYAAFEMGKLLDSLPGAEEQSLMMGKETTTLVDGLISSIKKVIGYTLEKTTKLPNDAGGLRAPRDYDKFADIIDGVIKNEKGCTIITFNYDLGLDYALYSKRILVDYGLSDIAIKEQKFVAYFKLHGSLNWGKCRKCGKIIPYRQFGETEHITGRDYNTIPAISNVRKLTCGSCKERVEEDPFIVPPTWNKTAYHTEIDLVWKRAAQELKDAENIFVFGYSLPTTDLFFNYLFALGVDMRTILKGFYVFNPDPDVSERFRELLGSGIIHRYQFMQRPFNDVFAHVRSILNLR